MSPKKIAKNILSALWSLVSPKTSRGKVRRATFVAVALFVIAGTIAESKYWNAAAGWANGQLDRLHAPSNIRLAQVNVPFRLGLDLQGGSHLVYVADVKSIPDVERAAAMDGVRDVIERRVNAYGVSEPVIQTNKSGEIWRVIVDLAGVKDVSEAISLIGGTPVLEFKEQSNEPPRPLTAEEKSDQKKFNDDASKRAVAIVAKAKESGADFGALAAQYSEDEATKNSGGDLGVLSSASPLFPITQIIDREKVQQGQVLAAPTNIAGGLHIAKLLEKTPVGVEDQASHILICFKGAERCAQDRTREEARSVIDGLKAQATTMNFADLAKKNSDEPNASASGGSISWVKKGELVPAFENALFALQKGAISDVVETQFGFHLIYKSDERPVYGYHLAHIFVKTKADTDYVPAEPWKNSQLSGKHLKRALLEFNQQTNEPQVVISFNDEGKKLFGDLTTKNVGKPIAIFLDGSPISVPTVNEPITDGSAVISGKFTVPEAKLLAQRLNAGALPVPITLESQQSVGASLGRESLDASLRAGLIGFLFVALFMLLYYRLPGLIAIAALSLYSAINIALYKLIPVTLTLPGIAGLILSVGMAVDANVLIFERLKEELFRGRPLASAIDEGFKRAWTSIRDANVTTLISCVILFYTSSSLIRGFAFTLALGVLISMISAITVSRTLLRLVAGWKPLRERVWMYLPALHRLPANAEGPQNPKV